MLNPIVSSQPVAVEERRFENSAFPTPLPPGMWDTEQFDIHYPIIKENRWGEHEVDAASIVYAATEKDGSHMIYYFSPSCAGYAKDQKDLIHAIGTSKNIHFNINDYHQWFKIISKGYHMGIQEMSGTCFHESFGWGTWKAVFSGSGPSHDIHKQTLLTISFNKNNDDFFETVKKQMNFE